MQFIVRFESSSFLLTLGMLSTIFCSYKELFLTRFIATEKTFAAEDGREIENS